MLVGITTSGNPQEGWFDGRDRPHDNWSRWKVGGRAAAPGAAGTLWRDPADVLDRAVALGATAFGLSVEWARLEPRPGELDTAALERYAEILAECRARGLEPVVTLHHFTHPWWQGPEFWLRPGSPDVFARHVTRVVTVLAPHCRRWVTIHDANVVAFAGWITGTHPPGRRLAVSDAWCVLDNLLTAHVLAADAITDVQPGAEVTLGTRASPVYEQDRLLADLVCRRDAGIDAPDIDRWVDERRAVHDAAFPPRHVSEAAWRRLCAAVAPYGTVYELGRGRTWARLRAITRRRVPRRVVTAVEQSRRGRALDVVAIDWRDSGAGRSLGTLGSWCATEAALRPGLGLWVLDGSSDAAPPALAGVPAAGLPVRGYWRQVSGAPPGPRSRACPGGDGARSGRPR